MMNESAHLAKSISNDLPFRAIHLYIYIYKFIYFIFSRDGTQAIQLDRRDLEEEAPEL